MKKMEESDIDGKDYDSNKTMSLELIDNIYYVVEPYK